MTSSATGSGSGCGTHGAGGAPAGETGAGGSGPAGVASSACVLRDAYTNLPVFGDPDLGVGYAKMNLPGVHDLASVEAACTGDVYAALLTQYCAANTNPAQREVAIYAADGSYQTTGCGAAGCEYVSCPGAAQGSTGSTGAGGGGPATEGSGACVLRDPYSNLPAYGDPDLGMGYAKKNIPGVDNLGDLKVACTSEIFADLLTRYCATSTNPVQLTIATYDANGSWLSTTCGALGCEPVSCP